MANGLFTKRRALEFGTMGASELARGKDAQVTGIKRSGSDLMFQNVGARPQDPTFQGITGPGGRLLDQFRLQRGRGLQQAGLGEFQQRLAQQARQEITGPSQTAQIALQRQQMGEQGLRGRLARQSISGQSQAEAGLAARGGLSGGARERLAAQGFRERLLGQQRIGAQGQAQRLGIEERDLAQQLQRQQQLQGGFAQQEEARLRTDVGREDAVRQFNIAQAIQDQRARNQFNLGRYQEQMREFAAAKEAAQQEKLAATKGGLLGSGGFLGTGFKFGV